jgi:hypothetical protein
MRREFITHLTKIAHFPAQLSTSAPSHHAPSLAAFITDIAESDFSVHTGMPVDFLHLARSPNRH